jgi:hypothetical protein
VVDAELWVSTGIGSLQSTPFVRSGADGRYRITFQPGVMLARKDRPGALQAAIVGIRKQGYEERDLRQGGNLQMAWELTRQQLAGGWQPGPERTFLPGRPLRVDFVLVPAATLRGRLLKPDGQPLADREVVLVGDRLPPGAGIYGATKTDPDGAFTFRDVSTRHAWSLSIHAGPHYHDRTPPERVAEPREHTFTLVAEGTTLTGDSLFRSRTGAKPASQ